MIKKVIAGIAILCGLLIGETNAQNYVLTGRNAFADTLILNNMKKNNPSTTMDSLGVFRRLDGIPGVRLSDYSTTFSDSNYSEQNGQDFKRALKYAVSIGKALILPSDTTYIDTLWFSNLSGIAIKGDGNSVLAYRNSVKSDSTNTMLRFTDCSYILIDDITFLGNMGSGSGNGYNNAVIPLYFQGGDDGVKSYGSNDYIIIRNSTFKDCWWIGFGGRVRAGEIKQVADTVATHVSIRNNLWPYPAKRGPVENAGHKAITTLGIVQFMSITGNEFHSKNPDDGVVYANGFYLLGTVYDALVSNNKSYDAYDSDYYSFIRRGIITGNYSYNSGKDGIKNIRDTGIGASHPDWPGVGELYVVGNYVRGTGRIVAGSPVGYNFDGDRNYVAVNTFEAQDTTGYIAKQSQIAFRAGYTCTNSIFAYNIVKGNNGLYSGRPMGNAFFMRDTVTVRENAGNLLIGNVVYESEIGISSVNYNRFIKIFDNKMFGIDSVGFQDYFFNSEKVMFVDNTIQAKYIYRYDTNNCDSLIQIGNKYFDYTSIYEPGNSASPIKVLVDTLNVGVK